MLTYLYDIMGNYEIGWWIIENGKQRLEEGFFQNKSNASIGYSALNRKNRLFQLLDKNVEFANANLDPSFTEPTRFVGEIVLEFTAYFLIHECPSNIFKNIEYFEASHSPTGNI